jgi:hypothetical protein
MMRLDDYGVVALGSREASDHRGGDLGAVELGIAIVTAMGAGFVWGYSHLGPAFNRYF